MALAFLGSLGKIGTAWAEEPRLVGNPPVASSSTTVETERAAEGAAASPAATASPVTGTTASPATSSSPPLSASPTQIGGAAQVGGAVQAGGAAQASAAPAVRPADAAAAETPNEGGKGKKKKSKRDKRDLDRDRDNAAPTSAHARFGAFEIKGRVYTRAEYDRRKVLALNDQLMLAEKTIDSTDVSVPTARVSLQYRAPIAGVTAIAEIDMSGKPDMRDGYLQAKGDYVSMRVGQFKVPVSNMAATSPWTLPMVRRGLLHDVLIDRLDYGGRRPGVTVAFRDRDMAIHPRLTLGAFQGSVLVKDVTLLERDTDLLNAQKFLGQSFVARAEIEVLDTELGVYYHNRVGSPAVLQTSRYWTVGVDAHYDRVFEHGGLRIWLDGIAGASWYELSSKPADGKDPVFVLARALVAYRFGGTTDVAFYVEPYAQGGGLDPDTEVTSDLIWEAFAGVNVGLWNRARLTLQGEINKGQRNFPTGYFGGPPPDRLGLILQAGVAF